MPRRNIDTSKLEQLAINFYKRSEITKSPGSIKDARIKGIQQEPITVAKLVALGGSVTPEEYFGRSETMISKAGDFLQSYLNLIETPAQRERNLNIRTKAVFEAAKASEGDLGVEHLIWELMTRENLDLSIFNNDIANQIYGKYLGTALPLKELLTDAGFPGISFPSTNAYRQYARYSVDVMSALEKGEGIHPQMLSLMRSNLNIKEYASELNDISIGRTRMRNPISLENATERTKRIKVIEDMFRPGEKTAVNYLAFDPINDKGTTKTILTWDTETTGLSPDARVRNVALVKRQVRVLEDGTTELVSAPEVIMTKHFRSDMMDLAHVYRNGKPVPLSVGAILSEMGPDAFNPDGSLSAAALRAMQAFDGEGAIALKDLREILEAFMGKNPIVGQVHRLEGHNSLAFDIDKLYDTIKSISAYNDPDNQDAKAVKELWKEFTLKRGGPLNVRDAYYAQDTLDSTIIHMELERKRIFQAVGEAIDRFR